MVIHIFCFLFDVLHFNMVLNLTVHFCRFWDSVVQDTVTVYAFDCGHKISTYRLLALSFIQMHLHQRNRDASRGGPVEQVHWWNKAEPAKQISNISRKRIVCLLFVNTCNFYL